MDKVGQTLSYLVSSAQPRLEQAVLDIQSQPDSLQLQQQAVSNTLEAVMHEIRNPLMSVGGFARRLLAQEDAGGNGNARRYAKVIIDEAARLDKVLAQVGSLLAQISPQISDTSLLPVLENFRRRLDAEYPGFLSSWRVPGQDPLQLKTDPKLFAEALTLITGYIRQCAGKKPLCDISLQHSADRLTIKVNAPGLARINPVAMHDLAFGPELGLLRARRILDALGGVMESEATAEGCMIRLNFSCEP
jgi:K+-sensing histidine kinase KdpD